MNQHGRLEIGLIGFGAWASKVYSPLLKERDDIVVKAVAARSETTQAKARDIFGSEVQVYSHYTDLLSKSDVKAVMICLPHDLTLKASIAAVEAKKHVWIEPPFDEGNEGFDRLVQETALSGKVLHHNLELHYLPVIDRLLKVTSDERFGKLNLVKMSLNLPATRQYPEGYIFEMGSWYIDLIEVFINAKPENIQLIPECLVKDGSVRKGIAVMSYHSALKAEWYFNFYSNINQSLYLEIVGSRGEAFANLTDGVYRYRYEDDHWKNDIADCSRPVYGFIGMRESLDMFVSSILGPDISRTGIGTYRNIQYILSELYHLERKLMRR